MSRAKIIAITVGVVVAVIAGVAAIGYASGWGRKALDVVSPGNVAAQHRQVIGTWQSLQAAARNACGAQSAASSKDSPTFVEDPALAYEATYRRMVADYNRRQKNLFEAGIVGPAGYPKEVPALDNGPGTDWCQVAAELTGMTP